MLRSVLLFVGVVGVTSRYRQCSDDPNCAQASEPSLKMTVAMLIIQDERDECHEGGACPIHTPSITGEIKPCEEGLSSQFYPCKNIDMLSFVNLEDLGGSEEAEGNDIWGWVDGDDKWAFAGLTDGSAIVDVTDPVNPVVEAWLPSNVNYSVIWRDLKVFEDYLYVVADDDYDEHHMQYLDLDVIRQLKDTRPDGGRDYPVTIEPTGIYDGFGNCHNIFINEETGYLYAVGTNTCNHGLHMVDVNTEDRVPQYAGCFSEDGYTHDTECVIYHGDDSRYQGKEICFAYNVDALTIVDVEDKENPVMISTNPYAGSNFTHQGWCTADHNYLLLNDELDEYYGSNDGYAETYIWDVSSLEEPELLGSYYSPVLSIDHNLYIKNEFAYLSNYESGLRILNISGIASAELSEVGYFDVYPEADTEDFHGAWSVYPFYDDTDESFVVVQSIDRGLFVLQPNVVTDSGGFLLTCRSWIILYCLVFLALF